MPGKTVLFCGPIDNPRNSGRYMMAGMEKLGLRVTGYDYRTRSAFEKEILDIVIREKPDYVFTLKGEKLSPALIESIKNSGSRTILWITTSLLEDWMVPFARSQDFVVTTVENQLTYFREKGVKNITWIHQGFDPEFFGIEPGKIGQEKTFYADVAMIGSMGYPIYKKRCELVMSLRRKDIDIKWWGPRLAREIRNIPYFLGGVQRAWAGKEVYMRDFADVIRHTRIFIGQESDIPVGERYMSNRVFAVLGCGGFYLCRRTQGVESQFEVGKELQVFDDEGDLLEKIGYYLNHEEERQQIALAGHRKVLSHYTYKHQMEKIFKWVEAYDQGRRPA
ncbi:MAG TPA: glycosyltransferase [Syntrophales bacterium]|nr:glycosyltransferase [Syntrophales bacterium]HOX93965.1 glycosyltransferase [Syntrophales bacterium]HPI57406.1 glycosyltransferase [Syntrophales bacterium]HPN25470.1 glycosyltransferase [Syntrophales bacterium]HQM29952.1 glycosyltransferase [Syntrophales bacterium]